MSYAIFESGGKQYVAREGEQIDVDRMSLEPGKSVTFDQVLLAVDGKKVHVGTPLVTGAKIKATVVEQVKGPKVIVFKYKPKQRYRVKQGHRQRYTRIEVQSIGLPAAARKKSDESAEEAKPKKKSKPKED